MRRGAALALLSLAARCSGDTYDAPGSASEQPAWLQGLIRDRNDTLERMGWTGGVFDVPELRWTQTSYIQPQVHPYDRYFYDPDTGNYTVQRFLDDVTARYGGIDALLLWPTYTNIGIDDRNKFDMFRAMPGGLAGIARITKELQDSGVKVLWPYLPWDKGTRHEEGGADDAPSGYDAFDGANCYQSHGGTDIDSSAVSDLTAAQCVARCDADSACDCVTYDNTYGDGDCWKRKNCDPAGFEWNTEYTVYMKAKGYSTFAGKNCYSGWGGDNIDVDPVGGLSAAQCMARCDQDVSCSCVTYQPGAQNCWKRANCRPGNFDGSNGAYTVYVNGARAASPGKNDAETFAALLKETGADGINGDTMGYLPRLFWDAAQKLKYPLAFEPELGGNDRSLGWSTMAWGYWGYPKAPVVDRLKWLSRGKFLTNVCDRWAKSKTDNLQSAWFNGDGYESWENVWGTWNGITPRDGEAIRRVAAMLRYFGKAGYLQSPDWEPHTTDVVQSGVYASRWPLGGSTLWTVVNRAGGDLSGAQLRVASGGQYYDCYRGVELAVAGGSVAFDMESGGYGCVLHTPSGANGALGTFLGSMATMTRRTLASYAGEWQYLPQLMIDIPATPRAASAPAGMVSVPAAQFDFAVDGVEIEGDDSHGVDVQYPWEQHPQRSHRQTLDVGPFYIDKYPVTCAKYSAYLAATGFRPTDPYNWLKNWGGARSCPAGLADRPVTYVSLKEARAYCAWAGARLPHSHEWQYAAQGTDGRTYPWGGQLDDGRLPLLNKGIHDPGREPVTAHAPAGDSPFGVSDLVGNVWQYTTEFRDDHTRSVVLRGGSNYRPSGSDWYFPRTVKLTEHNKYFLMDDCYERAATIGFRCLVDA